MAAATVSVGGAILFDATDETYTDAGLAPIMLRGIQVSGGKTAGAFTLKEGVSAAGVADASGKEVYSGWVPVGANFFISLMADDVPYVADRGLKCGTLTTSGTITAYLA